ncbi:MAG: sialidase family protein [Nitrospirota bacterium]
MVSMAVDGEIVIIAWNDRLTKPGNPGFFARSIDGGRTFSPPVNLSTKDEEFYRTPSVAIDGQNVFMTWAYSRRVFLFFYINRLFLFRSTDGGATFSGPVNIAGGTKRVFYTSVAVDGKTVIAGYTGKSPKGKGGDSPFLVRSTNGGKRFSNPINLFPDIFRADDPSVAIDGQTVIATWRQTGHVIEWDGIRNVIEPYRVWFARSTDGGATFSPQVNLSSREGWFPSVGISGQTVLIPWVLAGESNGVLLSRSTDGGATFSAPVNISRESRRPWTPSMAIDGQTVIVAWVDSPYKDQFDIWFVLSRDGGATFSNPVNLSNTVHSDVNPVQAHSPSVALDGQTAFVAWTGSISQNDGVFLARIPLAP